MAKASYFIPGARHPHLGCVWDTHTDADTHPRTHTRLCSVPRAQIAFWEKGVKLTSCSGGGSAHSHPLERGRGAVGSRPKSRPCVQRLEGGVLGKIAAWLEGLVIAHPPEWWWSGSSVTGEASTGCFLAGPLKPITAQLLGAGDPGSQCSGRTRVTHELPCDHTRPCTSRVLLKSRRGGIGLSHIRDIQGCSS